MTRYDRLLAAAIDIDPFIFSSAVDGGLKIILRVVADEIDDLESRIHGLTHRSEEYADEEEKKEGAE